MRMNIGTKRRNEESLVRGQLIREEWAGGGGGADFIRNSSLVYRCTLESCLHSNIISLSYNCLVFSHKLPLVTTLVSVFTVPPCWCQAGGSVLQ